MPKHAANWLSSPPVSHRGSHKQLESMDLLMDDEVVGALCTASEGGSTSLIMNSSFLMSSEFPTNTGIIGVNHEAFQQL